MSGKKKSKKAKSKQCEKTNLNSGDALDGHPSIESWERSNGRGFWGNSTTGYLTDEEVNNI